MSDNTPDNTGFVDSLGEFKGNELFEGVESITDLAQKHVDLSTQHGELKSTLPVVPESIDGYTIAFPEGMSVDEADLGAFKQTAHELGMTQAQYEKVVQFDIARNERISKAASDKAEETITAMKTEMGDDFEPNMAKAQKLLEVGGGKELADRIDLGNDPVLFKFLHTVGGLISEDSLETGGRGGSPDSRPKSEDGKHVLKFKDM